MANQNSPFGFRPSRRLDGAVPNYALSQYRIAYNYGTTIAKGDPVTMLVDGTVGIRAGGSNIVLLGIFWGCQYLDPNTGMLTNYNSWTAPTLASTQKPIAQVITDKNMIFQCRVGGATTVVGLADVGANFDTGGESTPSPAGAMGLSTAYLLTTAATTATFPFRLVGVNINANNPIPNNDPALSYSIVEVIPNFYEPYYTTGQTS